MSVWEKGPNTPDQPGDRSQEPSDGGSGSGMLFGNYYDGKRALRQRVVLRNEVGDQGRVLAMELPDGSEVRWPVRRIRRLPDQAHGPSVTYGMSVDKGARLVVEEMAACEMINSLAAQLHDPMERPPLGRRAALVCLGGAAALAVLFFLLLPGLAGLLTRFMDPEAEVAMGEIHYDQTRQMFSSGFEPLRECGNKAGKAALVKLTARVSEGVDLPYNLRVAVVDDRADPILNAYAVAGGYITFFDSMIQAAESPEEIAAVLAHELGHVVHRDPVRHQLQAASGAIVLSVLIGDVTGGGILGGTAGAALQSSYSRSAETEADEFAHAQLTAVGLPPSALGRMFERLRAEYGDTVGLTAHFSSHPQLADRIERAADVGDPVSGAPALSQTDWLALRNICR